MNGLSEWTAYSLTCSLHRSLTHSILHSDVNFVCFQKLMQSADCMNSDASIFKRVVVSPIDPKAPYQLISQKRGLPANKKYLAVDWTFSGPLFLTNNANSNRKNRFKITY